MNSIDRMKKAIVNYIDVKTQKKLDNIIKNSATQSATGQAQLCTIISDTSLSCNGKTYNYTCALDVNCFKNARVYAFIQSNTAIVVGGA